ncbi:tape measure protein [Pseudomonas sp. S5(2021)]|nr:tape measure protein [Pseudomonas sp. S5(2021)]
MVDIASLAIQIDTSDVARAESDLAKLNGAGAKAEKAANGVEGAFTGAAKAAGIYRDAAGRLREANGKFVTEARKVELGLKGIGDQAKKTGAEFNGLSNVAGKVGASIVAALSVREVYQATEAYTSISNRLRLVTDSAGAFAAAQAAVFRVAQEGRQPLTETAELYQRIATNQKQLGLTGEGVARVTETISKSLAVSGASAATAAGALTQLGQAFASGTLRGEELNSVLEGAPALAQTLARGLNVTVGELRALGAEGKLTAEQVVGAILSQSDAMDEAFGKLAPNISGALTTVGNSFTQLIGKMDETSGASSDTASAIMKVADILSDPSTIEAAQVFGTGVAKGFSFIVEAATTTVGTVKWMAEELAATFNGIAGGDIVRLEEELARLQEMRESGPLDRLVFFGTKGTVNYATDAEIDAEIEKIQRAIISYEQLGSASTQFGESSASAAPKIEAFRTGTASLGTTAAEAAGKTDKQATAFQSLMDGLFPAEAAQRQYNEQVALLDKYLDGDQLAKAIDRLNHSIEGADATGPGDAIEEYRKELQRLEDQLDPVGKATKQYQQDVKRLDDALGRGELTIERHGELMAELGRQYDENRGITSEWVQWTESSLERVDGAFADAWRNIGDGFAGFRDSLTNAFKQMLAELAHMAITQPIVMQIGAAIGIGGGGSGGILSSLGGSGGGGGFSLSNLLNYGQTAYSMLTGVGPAALAGYQSGGIMGGLQGAAGYYGNLASSAWGTVSGWFGGSAAAGAGSAAGTGFGYGQSLVSGQIGNAAYAGAQAGAGSSLSGIAGNLGAIVGPIAGLYMAVKGYGAISDGYDFKPKDFDDEFSGVRLGAKVINAYENGITKVFGDSSFLSKALRIPVATIGGLMSSVFGGGWETKNYGLAFSVVNGDFLGQSYEDQKKKGGLFGSDKKRTKYRNLDPETAAALQETYDATEDTVAGLFESLSYSVEEASLAGLQLARTKISTKGKTEEEIQQAIAEWFGTAADAMTAELNKVFATGLDLDFEGMQAFVGNLQGVNEVLRYLDVEMYDASVAGGKLAESLSAAAGGLEALATNSQTYYSAFFSEAEKIEDTIDSIKRAFESADVELASSREAYRAMVEDIDLTTEAGQEMFATLMALSGQAAQYYSILEQQAAQATAAANAALFGAVDTAYAALQRSIANQQRELQAAYSARVGSLNDMAAAASANLSGMTGIANSLDAALKRLRGTSDDAVRMLRAQAVMTLNSALVTARAGGSLAGFEGLQDALDVASEMDASLYGSLEDFEREQGRTANLVAELEKVNGKQLTTEEKLLRSVQDQLKTAQQQYEADMAGLDAQLSYAQAQLDALNGIDNSVMGVAAAIAAMNASVVAALGALPKGAAQANTPQNNGAIVSTLYSDLFGRTASADEVAYWSGRLRSGDLEYSEIAANMQQWASPADKEAMKQRGIPGFASGGFHSGGLRLVGENGPELEVTGPSRIYNASQTAAMLGGGSDTTKAIASLQQSVERQGDALRSIAKHAMQTAKRVEFLERWDYDGLPTERATA